MIKYFIILLAGLLPVGCVDGESASEEVSIAYLRSLYRGYPVLITEPLVVRGVVVSTDRYGESYHRLTMQDHTAGVEFSVDCDHLYRHYSVGDSLRIECCGLTLGGYGRAVRVGAEPEDGYEVSDIGWSLWQGVATNYGVATVQPAARSVTIADLSAELLSQRVLLEGVRFVEAGERWAEEEGMNTTRHIVDAACDTLSVRTSGYSDFFHHILPEGECDVLGLLGYFGSDYQLVVFTPDDVLCD